MGWGQSQWDGDGAVPLPPASCPLPPACRLLPHPGAQIALQFLPAEVGANPNQPPGEIKRRGTVRGAGREAPGVHPNPKVMGSGSGESGERPSPKTRGQPRGGRVFLGVGSVI